MFLGVVVEHICKGINMMIVDLGFNITKLGYCNWK